MKTGIFYTVSYKSEKFFGRKEIKTEYKRLNNAIRKVELLKQDPETTEIFIDKNDYSFSDPVIAGIISTFYMWNRETNENYFCGL